MAGAHLVVRESLRHPRLSAVPIETRGVFAYRDRSSGALVVSSSTQSPYTLRDVVAAALGLPVEEVRVIVPDVGGGFGPKGPIYPEEVLVAAAAHRLGRPVKWIESRRESLACMGHDREQAHDARIGFQFLLMGLLAEMLVRTYHESQAKPIYTVREKIGFEKQ